MERPRRHVRPPGALNDYLTADDSDKKNVIAEDDVSDSVDDDHKEVDSNEGNSKESKKILLSQPYKCSECKARYRSKVALLRHAVKHSGDKPFTCPECGKGLSSQCALSEHRNIHTNSRPHRCDKCGQESRQLSVHLRHLLTHETPEHMYCCSVCGKSFKQNEYLRRHMRKHTGEKPFICEECGKSFTCKSELNRHKKRHSSERPHTCPDCGQTFKMLHNLRTHIKAHTGTQQWKCLLCSAVFPKPKLLEAHRKTHLESVQHLEVNRPNENTLIVTAEGDDRRKLPTVHNVLLPKDKVGNIISPTSPQKKLLRINDTTLPLELILKSVGKGSNIKIKIIDKPAQSKPEAFPVMENIVELIDEERHELQEGTFAQNQHNSMPSGVKTMNYEPVQVTNVLSIAASIESHCLSNHYLQIDPASEDYRCWLATLSSLCRELDPPYSAEVCKLLHQITTGLQLCLIQGPRQPLVNPSHTDSGNLTSALPCGDSSEYQFIYEQYATIMGKLQNHFSYNVNNNE